MEEAKDRCGADGGQLQQSSSVHVFLVPQMKNYL